MSSLRDHILLEYGAVADGAVLSGHLCPSCMGGSGGERSLSVGRTGGLLWWRCHRNKCGFRGVHGAKQDPGLTKAVHQKGRWNYQTEPLSEEWLNYLSSRFRILNEILDREWQWTDSYGGRVVMPVRNEYGVVTAYNLRSYDPEAERKALLHRVMEEAGQAWYKSSPYPSHIIITEDQPSALRASTWVGVNSIALLGTHLPESLVERIRFGYDYSPVVLLALDQDATQESVDQVIRWRERLPMLRVFPLSKDLKDMHHPEFHTTMTYAKEIR